MEIINMTTLCEMIPENYTGIVYYTSTRSKYWYKEGRAHRIDGPAVECPAVEYGNGERYWWVDGVYYFGNILCSTINSSIFLGIEKGKYDLRWIKFLTEDGVEEYPIIPGMETDPLFKKAFRKLSLEI